MARPKKFHTDNGYILGYYIAQFIKGNPVTRTVAETKFEFTRGEHERYIKLMNDVLETLSILRINVGIN